MNYSTIKILNKKTIIYTQNISLLSILKKNNIHIGYQCKSGYCGTCRIEIIQGKVNYLIKQPIAALFKKNEIFPCCCKPNGNIIIKINHD
ncbi:2Fe-2S iron-sulfur cluster binding domain-containing protein [Buchnera aphidicola (Aphis craccivora)]|uniref:Class I ribonucleotide reductase maintenance protein YfaE n=1 Tax=Buchnera aphidicola (Aphis craccivora) TaxID=466616 RepID=A0A4D6XGV0_9GAMM|nr:class I ribonucleotide reductase maintenance protein YfaE [Buchnera aphidicola]QCI16436.1 2Fe-2S iron-sulfur cluster binding domain-containing protein [Buchnera aphidicola (Aphis craccivora)]QLL40575.1 2Fe-2S iron-sulfur cluster binding domain-containing protein [Buchnera aphidicola (Aphis craccivore)]WAI17945.1 MAG: class I ribonucleotide reductase maintenance protein YfaE [Buchnera aphidicola (Aphis craccivora)]